VDVSPANITCSFNDDPAPPPSASARAARDPDTRDKDANPNDSESSVHPPPAPAATSSPTPALRRSLRVTRKPAKYSQAIFSSLAFLSLLSFATASFTKVAPLVWRVTDRPVISGVTRVHTKIAYESPCYIFNASIPASRVRFGIGASGSNNLLDSLHAWCEAEFETSFIQPLESFCSSTDKEDHVLSRIERAIAAAVLVTTAIISVITTIGITSYATSQSARNEIMSIEEQQDALMKEMEKNMVMNDKVKEILFKLDKRSDVLSHALNNATERIVALMNFHVPSVTTVSNIGSSLAVIKERFFSIGLDWKRGIMNPLFLKTMNVTLPCADECPERLMTPLSCRVDTLRKTIKLSFEQRTTKSKTKILKADPFRLITNTSDTHICFGSYGGPSAVIYDEKLDCVTPIRGDADSQDNMILSPAIEYCTEAVPINESMNYWSRTECIPRQMIRDDDIIQIKSSDQYNYIYCHTLKISVFNRTMDCPDYTFAIPYFASFTIGKLTYRADSLQLTHSLKVAPVTTSRVNFHLLPTLSFSSLHSDITKLQMGTTQETHHHYFYPLNKAHSWLIIGFSVFGILSIMIYFRVTKRRVRSQSNPLSTFPSGSETVRLTKGYQKEEIGIEDNDGTDTREVIIESPRRQTRSSFRSKQTALLCALSLALLPESTACPDLVTLSIDMSLCTHMNNTDQNVCRYYQDQVIDVPLSSLCNESSSLFNGRLHHTRSPGTQELAIPALTHVEDMPTLMHLIPMIEMQIALITDKWEEHKLHHSLFRMAQISLHKDCTSENFIPLSCRYGEMTKELVITAIASTGVPGMSASLINFTSRYSIILPSLIITIIFIFIICNKKRRTKRRKHTRLPIYQSDDDFPPPQPMNNRQSTRIS
jgi:hypothetical protein